MRFGIFRRFSHLVHRRTKSDSAVVVTQTPGSAISSSVSLDGLQTRLFDIVLPPAPPLSLLTLSPRPQSSSVVTPLSLAFGGPKSPPFTRADNDTLLRLSAAQKQASDLAAHSSHLKASIQALQARELHVDGAARKAKNDLERVRSLVNRQKRRSAELESQINLKKQELAQCKAFAEAMTEAGLTSLARSEYRNKDDLEETAVEAIREASDDTTGTWYKIMSFITGPRTQKNYVNAINMALQTRQEVRHWKKVTNFWKRTAREGKTKGSVPTPSSSNLSEIRETLSDERKRAVQELREKRKTLGLNPTTSNESVVLPYRLSDSHPSFTSVMATMSAVDSSRENLNMELSSRLPPLASDIFKRELISSHSSQRLFSNQSRKAVRPLSSETTRSRLSEKALGKRRAVENYGPMPSVDSISCDLSSGQISSDVAQSLSSIEMQASTSDFDMTSLLQASREADNTYNSLKSAEHALESFERICNRFSSGSNLSSLQSITEESTSDPSRRAPQTVVVDLQRPIVGRHGSSRTLSVTQSRSLSSFETPVRYSRGSESKALHRDVGPGPVNILPSRVSVNEGDETLIESGSEESNKLPSFGLEYENDKTLIEVEGFVHKDGVSKVVIVEVATNAESPSAQKPRSRLPIFRIPDRLSQLSRMSRMSGSSSSKRSLSSLQNRNSTSTISTQASKNMEREGIVKNLVDGDIPMIKPVLPLRVLKRAIATNPVESL
ncbi:hypothetical protein D9757_009384 [Collybiopsis confluens]|uniref:Uncharacterized protein n=1 Tax=Collybiopsis confluens TaxID=2823264 RepID=A0A8H5H6U7_9AGAR|nr:hypothetical protein D9757_009384 [Collybiopsis confluens]